MRKPWYTYLYVKSPILKILYGIIAVMISVVVIVGLAVAEEPRMQAQTDNWNGRSIEKGAEIWANNCSTCHGVNGQGLPGPALNSRYFFTQRIQDIGWTGTLHDYVELTVAAGRPSKVTAQWGVIMPTWGNRYGGPLRDDQITHVTNYVMNWESTALQQSPEEDPWIPFNDAPSRAEGAEEAAGEETAVESAGARSPQDLFTKARPDGMGCNACHMIDQPQTDTNRGIVGPNLGNLHETAGTRVPGLSAEEYVRQSIVDPNAHVEPGYLPGLMPQDLARVMTEEEIDSLVAWLLDPNREQ
jgi:mono/diheme cytochrome c family protein